MSDLKTITILGATGSIGVSTLDVLSRHPDRYKVVALTANTNVDKLLQQCIQYSPDYAVMVDIDCAEQLQAGLKGTCAEHVIVLSGESSLEVVSTLAEVDYVMAAIVGAAGLLPTLAAAKSGKRILLANKEALVMSGQLFMDTVRDYGAELLPIDSEHNAIFQCLPSNYRLSDSGIDKILLTGSGGPFLTRDLETFKKVTPEEAIAHPNWDMGKKISVDSATMMNKGLEVIEACWLFNVDHNKIQVVVHPQSIIHSMVSYSDGSVLAQMGQSDMRIPIAYSLAWPERIQSGVKSLDFFEISSLDFRKPDFQRFPCLRLAYEAHQQGGFATIALNAANEVAVDAFLKGNIPFTAIPRLIEDTLKEAAPGTPSVLNDILIQDLASREYSESWLLRF